MVTRRHVIGVGLIGLAGCVGGDGEADEPGDETADGRQGPHVGDTELDSAFPIVLYEPGTENKVADVHFHEEDDFIHWHQQPFEVPAGVERTVEARVYNAAVEPLDLGGEWTLAVEIVESADGSALSVDVDDELVTMHGESVGDHEAQFTVVGPGGDQWVPPTLPVAVVAAE